MRTSRIRCQLRLKIVIDVVTSWLYIVLFTPFLHFVPQIVIIYFHHQYVNIDCFYIKSGHNKINAIFCLVLVICTLNLGFFTHYNSSTKCSL